MNTLEKGALRVALSEFGYKPCWRCESIKGLDEFNKCSATADGLNNWCRDCSSRYGRRHAANNKEKHAAQYRRWYEKNAEHRLAYKRRLSEENPEHHREMARAKYARNREASIDGVRKWRSENQEKVLAHAAVCRALKRGDLVKWPCEVCGSTERVDAHHDDYEKPLEVRWLCRRHHRALHEGVSHAAG